MRLLLVARVELGEIGGVGALQKRRVGKHVVQFMSRHLINPAGRSGHRRAGQKGEHWAPASPSCNIRARVVPRPVARFAMTFSSRLASILSLAAVPSRDQADLSRSLACCRALRDLARRCPPRHRLDFVLGLPLPPEITAPAWPMRRPGGAVHPATNPTIGFLIAWLAGEEFRALLLGAAADLADHDDGFGGIVGEEQFERIDEVRAVDRIAADADAGRLAEPRRGGLGDRLVGEGARARDDADRAGLMDMARHDADLAFAGRDDAGAVRPDQARLRAAKRALDLDHVEHRDAFGDAHHEPTPASIASRMASAAKAGGT